MTRKLEEEFNLPPIEDVLPAEKKEEEKPIPRCLECGEETTHNRDSSWFGHVHRFGPRDHDFKSDQEKEG